MIFLNLALPERTCYEPLASTHPDTQGSLRPKASRTTWQRDLGRRPATVTGPQHQHNARSAV